MLPPDKVKNNTYRRFASRDGTWTEIQFFRFQDGKVAEHWVDVDLFSWFTQLGIIPKMG
jgi:hypothetical protein